MMSKISSKGYLAMGVILVVLVALTAYTLYSIYNNNAITGAAIGAPNGGNAAGDANNGDNAGADVINEESDQSNQQNAAEPAEDEEKTGCNYDNPPCQNGQECVYVYDKYQCRRINSRSSGGSGSPLILDTSGY